jgi:hypothetical protein
MSFLQPPTQWILKFSFCGHCVKLTIQLYLPLRLKTQAEALPPFPNISVMHKHTDYFITILIHTENFKK